MAGQWRYNWIEFGHLSELVHDDDEYSLRLDPSEEADAIELGARVAYALSLENDEDTYSDQLPAFYEFKLRTGKILYSREDDVLFEEHGPVIFPTALLSVPWDADSAMTQWWDEP